MYVRTFDYQNNQALVKKVVINRDVMTFYLRDDVTKTSINEFDVFMKYLKTKGYSFITGQIQGHIHTQDIHCCEIFDEHNHFHLKANQLIDHRELKNILNEIKEYQGNQTLREKLFDEKNGVSLIDIFMSFLGFDRSRLFNTKFLNGNQMKAIAAEFASYSSSSLLPEDNICKENTDNSFSKMTTSMAFHANLPAISPSPTTLVLANQTNTANEGAMANIVSGALILLTAIWLLRSSNKPTPTSEKQVERPASGAQPTLGK